MFPKLINTDGRNYLENVFSNIAGLGRKNKQDASTSDNLTHD